MTIAVVLLAAGRGSRLASPTAKPLLAYRGRPLVAWALDAARTSGCEPVVVVVGNAAEAVSASVRALDAGVRIVESPRWREGISQSLDVGLGAIEDDASVSAACIGLADQPRIGPEAYRRLAVAGQEGAEIAVATYHGVRQNPVLLARSVWAEARALTGDEGARQLMRSRSAVEVDCTGTGDPADVDTLDDLRALD